MNINLLPKEFILAERDVIRLSIVKKLSIGLLMFIILVSVTLSVLRYTQNIKLKQSQATVQSLVPTLEELKQKEALTFLFKQRINKISSLSSSSSKQTAMFDLITKLTPPEVKTALLSVDKNGKISFTGESSDLFSVNAFFTNVSTPEKNEDKIAKARLENLSVGRGGLIKFELSLLPK